jgi:hypothetical protein
MEKNLRTKQTLENVFWKFFFRNATKHRKIYRNFFPFPEIILLKLFSVKYFTMIQTDPLSI